MFRPGENDWLKRQSTGKTQTAEWSKERCLLIGGAQPTYQHLLGTGCVFASLLGSGAASWGEMKMKKSSLMHRICSVYTAGGKDEWAGFTPHLVHPQNLPPFRQARACRFVGAGQANGRERAAERVVSKTVFQWHLTIGAAHCDTGLQRRRSASARGLQRYAKVSS